MRVLLRNGQNILKYESFIKKRTKHTKIQKFNTRWNFLNPSNKIINSFGMMCQSICWPVSISANMSYLCSSKTLQAVMQAGVVNVSVRAPKIVVESVSKMTSCSPISLAKETASSMALASASSGPSGSGMHLLRAANTEPSWSRTTTPIPTDLVTEKTAASVLIFYPG